MRLGVIVVLWLCLCPMGVGLGRESGGLNSSAQAGAPAPASEGSAAPSGQAQNAARKPLTNDDVVGMLKAGLAENTIVLAIQHSSTAFDTSPQALIALHNQAVPPTVIDAMLKAGSEKSTFTRRVRGVPRVHAGQDQGQSAQATRSAHDPKSLYGNQLGGR